MKLKYAYAILVVAVATLEYMGQHKGAAALCWLFFTWMLIGSACWLALIAGSSNGEYDAYCVGQAEHYTPWSAILIDCALFIPLPAIMLLADDQLTGFSTLAATALLRGLNAISCDRGLQILERD